MAYSAPELLLVGAAQNLVLETSTVDLKLTCSLIGNTEQEDSGPLYDSTGLW